MSIKINVMAPLLVGDPADLGSLASQVAWNEFDSHLTIMKQSGIEAVSTDVWWGLVEPIEGQFNWSYYDQLSDHIIKAGLKWVPILSLHQCGGNVGDTSNVPIPAWIWAKLAAKAAASSADAVKFVSEQGNSSAEYVSFWATHLALSSYRALMTAFQAHFAAKASHIAEVNVSLGPAGELRYPSYNSHDKNTGWPTRGALQCYSSLALASFRDYIMGKYGDVNNVAEAWGDGRAIEPPADATLFYEQGEHLTQYGRDLFDWYQHVLVAHARMMLLAARGIFDASGAAFAGIDIGAKIPGIHWLVGTVSDGVVTLGSRLAELNAGLIRTSSIEEWSHDDQGRGYRPLLKFFAELQQKGRSRVVLHFTCLEMPDGVDGPQVQSLPKSLVTWVGDEARRQGVAIKGENALGFKLYDRASWRLMRSALAIPPQTGAYEGLTLLRMTDIAHSGDARDELSQILQLAKAASEALKVA